MKKLLIAFIAFVCLSCSGAQRLDLSSCDWTANGKPVRIPHSFTYLTPNGKITNTVNSTKCSYKTVLPSIFSIDPSKSYHIQLDGVGRCAKIFVNGKEIGTHVYGFLPARFDITKELLSGGKTNVLEIVVYQREQDAGIHQNVPVSGDFHVFAGLYRKAWIIENYKPAIPASPALIYKDGFFWDVFGNKVFLKGVNYHQYFGYDWTYDEEKEKRDLMLIKQMGANAIRTAHYPKSPRFYELCNELGLYVFTEVPLVNQLWNSKKDEELYLEYVKTMVEEYRQYPCIVSWGLYNELTGNQNTNAIARAHELARRLDPTRPTYGANVGSFSFSRTPDILGVNLYWNWYTQISMSESFVSWTSKQILNYKKSGSFFITEYGASANINQRSLDKVPNEWMENMVPIVDKDGKTYLRPKNPNANPFHPADYQYYVHKEIWNSVSEALSKPAYMRSVWEGYFADHCGGMFVWQMFDTPTPQRTEGSTTNINLKGLMSIERKPKPAYDFYRKAWNDR